MSDYKTANLKPETMERLREYAVGDESVDSAVQRLLDSKESADVDDLRAVTATPEDLTALRSDVLERLDQIQNGNALEDRDFEDWFTPDYARTIAEHIRQELESGGGDNADELRELKGRLDDLESQLPRKVAQELGQ